MQSNFDVLVTHQENNEARQTLTEIYGWFTDGSDTTALKEAKAVLDELTWNSSVKPLETAR